MPGKEGRRFKYSKPDGSLDVERIQSLIDKYFDTHKDKPVSIPGLCLALDICKETLNLWEMGVTDDREIEGERPYYAELSHSIKKARLRIEQYLVETDGGKTKALKDMAALNASFGYRNSSEQNININANVRFSMGDLGDLAK
jgi:hypothetical protein